MALGALCISAMPAEASLIVDGITYTLTEAPTADAQTHQFTLSITGINGPSDTEGDRYGVESFALNKPSGFISASPPSGFTFVDGGLNASGCNGRGDFFCFDGATPSGPALVANSTLSYLFTITATTFANYLPDFKINWVGKKNNYELVSLPLSPQPPDNNNPPDDNNPPTNVPEPATLSLLLLGLVGFGFATRRRTAS